MATQILSSRTTSNPLERWHAMDALRVLAMLLGIFFHGSLAYTLHAFSHWPIHDVVKHPFFDALVFIIHLFRMELFFLISGFFTYQLYQKTNLLSFIKNRARKILVPFLIAWPVVTVILFSIHFKEIPHFKPSGIPLHHLWFLYYLLFFYSFTPLLIFVNKVILRKTVKIVFKQDLIVFLDRFYSKALKKSYHLLFLSFITLPFLFYMKKTMVETPLYFSPQIKLLLYYYVFFMFGWIIRRKPALLEAIVQANQIYFWVALPTVVFITYSFLVLDLGYPTSNMIIILTRFLYAIATWSLILFLIGFFHKHLQQGSRLTRHLANGSYWFYLAHLPLILILQNHFFDALLPAPMPLKPVFVIVLTFVILELSYLCFKTSLILIPLIRNPYPTSPRFR